MTNEEILEVLSIRLNMLSYVAAQRSLTDSESKEVAALAAIRAMLKEPTDEERKEMCKALDDAIYNAEDEGTFSQGYLRGLRNVRAMLTAPKPRVTIGELAKFCEGELFNGDDARILANNFSTFIRSKGVEVEEDK